MTFGETDRESTAARVRRAVALAVGACATLCAGDAARAVDDAAIADVGNTAEWLTYGRNHNEQRFSPLDLVDAENVAGLKVDWFLDIPHPVGLVSTPLVADGVIHFVDSRNVVRAADAATGELLWIYDPEVAKHAAGRMHMAFIHGSRGTALWGDKIYVATVDGRLIALKASSGEPVWTASTIDSTMPMYITGAPKAFRGKVLIGNGGTEHGPTRGYVTAYDADTGDEVWRFYVVPGNPADGFENAAMEMAAKTWTGQWWQKGGGGNVWHGMTYDPEFNAVYVGTGNGAPWNRKIRSPGGGDNLFLSSILALDADTGAYRWHYQTTPGETWDYNSNMDMVLADLRIAGRDVKALMHAPKNGFFYVIDRSDGRLVSAEPFAEVSWASHVDLETGRPVEIPAARYPDGGPVRVTPGPPGAHNWPPMSFNPVRGLVYIPTVHEAFEFSDVAVDIAGWKPPDWRAPVPARGYGVEARQVPLPEDRPAGTLQAWDPVRQRRAWEVPQATSWNPGTLTTGGDLVFQGTAAGDLVAYHAATGEVLWRHHMGLGISAPPITYRIGDRQYVALLVGWGSTAATSGGYDNYELGWAYRAHPRRLVVFSLQGTQELPPSPPPAPPVPLDDPALEIDEALADYGADVYGNCRMCHGAGAVSGGASPDLRASAVVLSNTAFESVVRGGALAAQGMPAFQALSDRHLKALQHYIRRQARIARTPSPAKAFRVGDSGPEP